MSKVEVPDGYIAVYYPPTGDDELDAIQAITKALDKLDPNARARVLQYCVSRSARDMFANKLQGPAAAGQPMANTVGQAPR